MKESLKSMYRRVANVSDFSAIAVILRGVLGSILVSIYIIPRYFMEPEKWSENLSSSGLYLAAIVAIGAIFIKYAWTLLVLLILGFGVFVYMKLHTG